MGLLLQALQLNSPRSDVNQLGGNLAQGAALASDLLLQFLRVELVVPNQHVV